MAVVALLSARGAPGVTTNAVAMTLLWPRSALLVEADTAGGSSVLAGYLRGAVPHDRGVVGLAVAQRREGLVAALWSQTVQLAEDRYLLPGPVDATQAASLPALWSPLAGVLRSLAASGTDVVVDAGRLGAAHAPLPVLRQADAVLLVLRCHLDAVAAARAQVAALREHVGDGAAEVSLLLVGEGRPYTAGEISDVLGLPVAATVAWDPSTAEVFSAGAAPSRRLPVSPLLRTLRGAVDGVREAAARRDPALRAPAPAPALAPALSNGAMASEVAAQTPARPTPTVAALGPPAQVSEASTPAPVPWPTPPGWPPLQPTGGGHG